jgi:hypothetical protein
MEEHARIIRWIHQDPAGPIAKIESDHAVRVSALEAEKAWAEAHWQNTVIDNGVRLELLRQTLEEVGPIGVLAAAEERLVPGEEEAELVLGIQRMGLANDALRARVAELTKEREEHKADLDKLILILNGGSK